MSYETIYKYDQRTVNARDAAKALNAYCDGLVSQGMSVQDIQQYRLENNDDLLLLYYVAEYYNTASGNPASFSDGADDVPVKELTVAIDTVQEGSGTPDIANPRLFTPRTAAKILMGGRNLLVDEWYITSASGGDVTLSKSGNDFIVDGANTSGGSINFYIKRYDQPSAFSLPAGTYTLSGIPAGSACTLAVYKRENGANTSLGYVNTNKLTATFTLAEKADNCFVVIALANGAAPNNEHIRPMLTWGSDAADFEPYTDVALTIPFGTEAGNVYGGTLNVTTGELTVTHVLLEFDGSETWGLLWGDTNPAFYYVIAPTAEIADMSGDFRGLFSLFKGINIWSGGGNNGAEVEAANGTTRLYVRYDDMPATTTAWRQQLAAWKVAGTPLQAVYKLKTPNTVQLAQAEVRTLLGGNNISADTGDVSVTYRAVPSLG